MENGTKDTLFVGVGGQGIILASEVLASLCLEAGYDVKQSEVHGMAQRGGSVISHVRYSQRVDSPVVEMGRADLLVSFELLEGLRWMGYLKPEGSAFINQQTIHPITVASGAAEYPDGIEDRIRSAHPNAVLVDGLAIAQQAGNIRAVNVALLGALSTQMEFSPELWESCFGRRVPPKTLEVNLAAFRAGRGKA